MTYSTACVALVVGATFFSSDAGAVSPAVRSACTDDFLARSMRDGSGFYTRFAGRS
jgi:hypothetical protein